MHIAHRRQSFREARTLNEDKKGSCENPCPQSGSISMRPSNAQRATSSTKKHQRHGSKRSLHGPSYATIATHNGNDQDQTVRCLDGMQHSKTTKCSKPKKPKSITKRYERVDVVAQANSQPPVTNQTPLMHLYGRHSLKPLNK